MNPPPAGMRGPMRLPGGPMGFLSENEKQNRPKVTKELLLRILKYLKPYRWIYTLHHIYKIQYIDHIPNICNLFCHRKAWHE